MITNPVVLITGSAKRIGAGIAKHLHSQDFNIIIHYRSSESEAKKLCDDLSSTRKESAICIYSDLNDYAQLEILVSQSIKQWGRVDLLINNASSFYPTAIGTTSLDDWDNLLNSNAKVPFYLSQLLSKELSERKGAIINMIDIHANSPLTNHTVYCMAKSALKMMTLSLAKELAPSVRVNGVAPGAILWPADNEEMNDINKEEIINNIPMRRLGSVEDVASAVYFLVCSNYITGQILAVDGGRSI